MPVNRGEPSLSSFCLTYSASTVSASNGVLRTLSRSTPAEWRDRALTGLQGDELLAVQTSHPAWVVAALRDALRADGRPDDLDALLEADNVPPRVALVALPGLARPADVGEPGAVSPVAAGATRQCGCSV